MYTSTPIRHQGNESLFLALEMSLICTAAGIPLHVHAEGLRGTGKTTVMRWARQIAPKITRLRGCVYQCRPDLPHCPDHSESTSLSHNETESVSMPFIEIGHGAKLGTILGSVDLARLTDPRGPKAALLPGAIPMANRGIVFIDEINRLAETAPEITDVLLSVMGTKPGKIKVEEVGLEPCEIQVNSSVWATSNPDEDPGPLEEIRRQLSDRFDMVVPVHRPSDPRVVQELLLSKHRTVPVPERDHKISGSIGQQALKLSKVTVPKEIIKYISNLYVECNIESLRAIESLELTARCLAVMREKQEVSLDEISTAMPMVLRHRTEPMVLSEILKDLELRKAAGAGIREKQEQQKGAGGVNMPHQPKLQHPPDAPTGSRSPESSDGCAPKDWAGSEEKGKHSLADRPPVPRLAFEPPRPNYLSDRPKDPTSLNLQGRNGQRQVGWLQKLLSRYHKGMNTSGAINSGTMRSKGLSQQNAVSNRSNASTGGEWGHMKQEAHGAPKSNQLGRNHFAPSSPVSPPEAARAISELNWEEILLPFGWKGHRE
ncbi:MAG TPA: hypothetical protein GXZ88_01375 [Firmicutes bacterium]|nr:hypothetical protein [Candidatus Fermentithermobacillaceae bacterium]